MAAQDSSEAPRSRLAYRQGGDGPPVLFLHGYPTSGRLWDPVTALLSSRFTCVAADLPGLGDSPPLSGRPDPDTVAREIEALRADLGLESWSVVGHDAGAVAAVHYAAAYPRQTDRLVLIAPPIFPELRPPAIFALLRKRGLGELLAPLALLVLWKGGLRSQLDRPTPEVDEIIEDFRRPFRGRGGARRLLWLVRWGDPRAVLARTAALLPGLTMPTLVLHGRRDRTVPESFTTRAAAAIPGARAGFLDGGHFLPLDAPEALSTELATFLGGVAPAELPAPRA